MAHASEQHRQDSLRSDFLDEKDLEHSDLMETQPPVDQSDILEPDDTNYALQRSNGHGIEGLLTHSAYEHPFSDNDSTTKDVTSVDTPPAASSSNDVEMTHRLQQACASRLPRKPTVTGAGAIFKGSRHTFNKPLGSPEHNVDGQSLEVSDPVEERGSDHVKTSNSNYYDHELTFGQVKKVYKAKCTAGQNTQEEDIFFKIAEKKEKARLASIEAEYLRARGPVDSDDSDEAVEDNFEPLFVPLYDTDKPVEKRRRAVSPEKFSESADEERRDSRPKRVRQGTHLNKYYEEERLRSMLAGIEETLAKIKRRKESKAKEANDTTHSIDPMSEREEISMSGATNAASNVKRKANKFKSLRAANNSALDGLLSSDVFEDAAANANEPALPVDTETLKSKAMTSLIASMPVEDRRAAGSDRQRILKATRNLGFRAVATDGEGKWTLKGMKSSLYNHQVLAASWMRDREMDRVRPNGGLLADAMGLGKTIEMIATMVVNKPKSVKYRPTLIVANQNLLNQWECELAKHIKDGVFQQIIRHSNSNRVAGPGAVTILQQADVVLTTYQELIKSYPDCQLPPELEKPDTTEEEVKAWWKPIWEKERKELHRVHFYRVVLDETQAIKNHKSKTSIACRGLMADMRWTLTATPISNTIEELFPYFRFLRVKHTGSFRVFKDNFCLKENRKCTPRLHSYLGRFMFRRTYADKLLGSPIVSLPQSQQRTKRLVFNATERAVYDEVRVRYLRAIRKVARSKDAERLKELVLTFLTRLRQMTAHLFLIQDTMQRFFKAEELESLFGMTAPEVAAEENHGQQMAPKTRAMIADNPLDIASSGGIATSPAEQPVENSQTEPIPTLSFKFRKYLRTMASNNMKEFRERTLCHKCKEIPDDPWVMDCLHVYCKECLHDMSYQAPRNGETQTACMECGEVFKSSSPCVGISELEMPDAPFMASSDGSTRSRAHKGQKNSMKWTDLDGKMLSSTKTAAVQIQIEQWLREEPDKKIIVFSQWQLLIEILARQFQQQGWKYCTYHGKMSYDARDKAINDFQDDGEMKIMIASLKCGGVGLNLTMASKVICTDLWYNSDVEQQAYCRVYRIGQTSETVITRFIVQDTVDEKLVAMQDRKRRGIGKALNENNMLRKLTVQELMELFGPVQTDNDGAPFIYVEEDLDSDSDPSFPELFADSAGREKSDQAAKKSTRGKGAKANKSGTSCENQKGDEAPKQGNRSKKGKRTKKTNNDSLLGEIIRSNLMETDFDEGTRAMSTPVA